jgi:hypothetical protein
MAPSATEVAPALTEEVPQTKVLQVEKDVAESVVEEKPAEEDLSVKPVEPVKPTTERTLADGDNVPSAEVELPEVRTGHKEPLKLSGAFDKFEHFDVTPVIGREYADVDLAEVLRAENSDELLRDLAIISMSTPSLLEIDV